MVPAPTSGTSLWRALEHERSERLWAVHRIDRGTSGVVVFARNAEAHRELSMAFEHARVAKTYLAFVQGVATNAVIETSLHPARRGRMRLAAPGEPGSLDARTAVTLLEAWEPGACLVEARPLTGRHHQIRVHLKSVGTPLLVDPIYGATPSGCASDLPSWRLTLHAHRLEVGGTVVESPLPDDLLGLRACLERA